MGKKKQKTIEATNAPVTSDVAVAELPVATEAEATPARKPKGKKKTKAAKTAEVGDPPAATEPAPKPKSKKSAKPAAGDITLAELSDRYIRALEDAGKSQGTAFSYRLELVMAQKELGAETLLRDLTLERVQEFFECARVTKTRGGVLKARVSVEKTKRVLRQALVWAQQAELIETAPLPTKAASAA
jgi:hypothetical protein